MDIFKFMSIEEFNAPETTSQALIDTRKYVGAFIFFGNVQHAFHDVVDEMERENFQGSTIRCMKVAKARTIERLRNLDKSEEVIRKYIRDIDQATKGAIRGEQ